MRLVLLRPEPGAGESAARAAALGLEPVTIALFAVEPVAWAVPDGDFDGLLLTSANALRHGGSLLAAVRGLSVHAVGEATAAAARAAGFSVASVGDGGVEALLEGIPAGVRLLHLAGADRRGHDDGRVTAVTVYRSVAIEPGPDLREAAGALVAVHSPRAGRRLAELVDRQGLERGALGVAAISEAAAAACGEGWRVVAVADSPRDPALLALAARLCHNGVA